MNQDKKQELTKEFMKSDLYEEMRDLLASHGSPKEAIPDLDGQKAIILEYNRYVPELIMDVVNVVRKHERQRIMDVLEEKEIIQEFIDGTDKWLEVLPQKEVCNLCGIDPKKMQELQQELDDVKELLKDPGDEI